MLTQLSTVTCKDLEDIAKRCDDTYCLEAGLGFKRAKVNGSTVAVDKRWRGIPPWGE